VSGAGDGSGDQININEPAEGAASDDPSPSAGRIHWMAPADIRDDEQIPVLFDGFRSLRSASIVVRSLLALSAVLAAVLVAASARQFQLVSDLKSNALSVGLDTLLSADTTARNVAIIQIVLVLITGIAFMVWVRRAYRNLAPLGALSLRFMPGWAIGAWFIPFLNLVRPKQIIDDTWRASDPAGPPSLNKTWVGQPVPVLIHLWWAAWVTGSVLGFTRSRIGTNSQSLDGVEASAITAMLAGLSTIVAALLAILVVADLTARQHARFDRIRLLAEPAPVATELSDPATSSEEPPTAVDGSRRLVGALAAIAILAVPVAYLTLAPGGESPSSAAGFSGEARLVRELDVGDCYSLPDDSNAGESGLTTLIAADVVPCTSRHPFEVVATATYGEGASSKYPGESEVALVGIERCSAPFEKYVGAPWPEGGFDMFVVQPLRDTWATGDRNFICAATTMDGSDLDHTVEHSGGALAPGQVTLFGVEDGDCFTLDDARSVIATIQQCGGPHQFEAYLRVASPSSDYPGEDAASEYSNRVCSEQFDVKITPTVSPNLGYGSLIRPLEAMWRVGKRDLVCVIWDRDSALLSSSYLAG